MTLFNHQKYAFYVFLFLPLIFSISNAAADAIITLFALYGLVLVFKNEFIHKDIFYCTCIIILYFTITSFFSFNVFESFHSSLFLIRFPLFLLAVLNIVKYSGINIEKISLIILLTVLLITVIIILEWIFIDTYRPAGPFALSVKGNGWEYKEFIAGNFISKFIFIAVIYVFYTSNIFIKKNKNIFFMLLLLTSIFAIFLTQERTAIIFVFCNTLFFIFFLKKNIIRNILLLIFCFLLLFLFSLSEKNMKNRIVIDSFNQLKITNNFSNYFNTARGYNYLKGITVWKSNPIIGTGIENYEYNCLKISSKNMTNKCANYTFNIYTDILSEGGSIGFILIGILFYLIIKRNIDYLRDKHKVNFFQVASFSTLLVILMPVLPSFYFFSQGYMIIFWVILSLNLISIADEAKIETNYKI